MQGYLGETVVNVEDTEFKDFTPVDWALFYIQMYGGCDGAHHKDWVLDQVVRILNGTKVIITEAKWENGHKEHRFELDEPTEKYKEWVNEITADGEYDYEIGIAP